MIDYNSVSFYIGKNFEKLNYEFSLSSDISFKLLGIEKDSTSNVGHIFLSLYNNINSIIEILTKSKKFTNEPFYKFEDFVIRSLNKIDKSLGVIIANDFKKYYDTNSSLISNTEESIKKISKEIIEHTSLLTDKKLYNEYYDGLINESTKRLSYLFSKAEIKSEKKYIEDLKREKNNFEVGKAAIKEMIEDMEEDKKNNMKILSKLGTIDTLLDKHIDQLINIITNYEHYFNLYFGIIQNESYKNKGISYFQSMFMLDFELPRCKLYYAFEKDNKIYPINILMTSVYANLKDATLDISNQVLYDALFNKTAELEYNDELIYLKCYEVTSLVDLLNIYFNFFIENKFCINKCKNCNKYFVPYNRTDEKYCDNISPQNSNKTCKEYGVKKAYRDKLNSNAVKKAHYNTSQFYRMKIKRAKTDKESSQYTKLFEQYKISYEKHKKKYNSNKITENDFINWINSQKILPNLQGGDKE